MLLVVDYDLCEANGACVRTSPAMFRVDESDKLHILAPRPAPDQMDLAKAAVRRCPRHALSLRDE
jgi:ferredoxin